MALVFACLLAPAVPIALKIAIDRVDLPSLNPETGRLVLDAEGRYALKADARGGS